jgi:endonuclease YncB( thermonuclease family)
MLLAVLAGAALPAQAPASGLGQRSPSSWEPGEERRVHRLFLEIVDGDSVVYRGRHLRFLGVDAPELASPEHGIYQDQPYGREAAMFTRREIKKARVVTCVADGTDRYGRLLVHLFVDGYPLSVRIVEAGLGYETVSVFGDNGFPGIAAMIMRAVKLHPELPFENPYYWRRRHRR